MKKSIYLFLAILIALSSCNDSLEDSLDLSEQKSETETVTKDELLRLLSYAYSGANYGVLGELSSDNLIDNNSPHENGSFFDLSAYDPIHDEMFAWGPIVTDSDYDSPSLIWEQFYRSISMCNHVLNGIEKLETEGKGNDVQGLKGEALISRAYHHFILVNIFSHAYKDANQTDLGIPYLTQTEIELTVNENRGTVPGTYLKIENDLVAGLELIGNLNHAQEKYHFNKRSAHAFAARFYLFKRNYEKVIEHADIVLGTNPSFRNWDGIEPSFETQVIWWTDINSNNNLLLLPTHSLLSRLFGTRYGCSRDARSGSLNANGPSNTLSRCFQGKLWYRNSREYGVFFCGSAGEFFEYTNKINNMGYPYNVRVEFSSEETLLCRAEARIHLGQIDEAFEDFLTFEEARNTYPYNPVNLTKEGIVNYFTNENNLGVMYKHLNTQNMSSSWIVSSEKLPFIHCLLLYRRVETIHNGMRFFDIKRYGIEITHRIGQSTVDVLTWNDPRRAIQIPAEVISAKVVEIRIP
ncbi:MAG: RagB/SusD family nutrient uptake outer membrane protein [Marinilabiliaceae bacterium]|nr:RagB/SusD family nutrient uptake outer membrane protein [Marinilabiliaceae bacterium]